MSLRKGRELRLTTRQFATLKEECAASDFGRFFGKDAMKPPLDKPWSDFFLFATARHSCSTAIFGRVSGNIPLVNACLIPMPRRYTQVLDPQVHLAIVLLAAAFPQKDIDLLRPPSLWVTPSPFFRKLSEGLSLVSQAVHRALEVPTIQRGYLALDAQVDGDRSLLSQISLGSLSVPEICAAVRYLRSYKPVKEVLPLLLDQEQ